MRSLFISRSENQEKSLHLLKMLSNKCGNNWDLWFFFPADRLLPWNILRKISASYTVHPVGIVTGETLVKRPVHFAFFRCMCSFATCPQKSDSCSEVVNWLCAWCIQTYNDSRVKLFSINWQPFTHAHHLSSENCKQSLSCVDNLYL